MSEKKKRHRFKWTDAEIEFVKNNAGRLSDREVAVKLTQLTGKKFTTKNIEKLRDKIGLKKSERAGHPGAKLKRIFYG